MKILMVLERDFPPDERVEKEITSLIETGHIVSIASYTFKERDKVEYLKGYTIYRKKITRLLYKSSAAALIVPFYFNFWYKYLVDILKNEPFDILHIHDLPLSKVGVKLSQKYNLKLVCDQHEYYSNWIIRTKHYNTLPGLIIKLCSNWKKYERKYLNKADMVITVEEELRKVYISDVNISPSKIISLPNTPSGKVFNINNIVHEIIDKYKGYFIIFYAGSIDHLRGLEFVAKCVSVLKNEFNDIMFLIAGKENKAFDLKKVFSYYGIESHAEFVKWIPLSILPSYIAASDICVFVPKPDNIEINNTIVTKIYQYASMGKPIIVSEARMMKEFVEKKGLGFSVPYGNIDKFCDTVRKIRMSPDIVQVIKSKSILIAKKHNWESTSKEFLNFYEKLKIL